MRVAGALAGKRAQTRHIYKVMWYQLHHTISQLRNEPKLVSASPLLAKQPSLLFLLLCEFLATGSKESCTRQC